MRDVIMQSRHCLPFSLSLAPWVFTKTTRPLVATLRSIGLRMIIYKDDILIMAPSPTVAREHTAELIFQLENLGFIINNPKSVLIPTQEILFLGFTISYTMMEIRLPGDKILEVQLFEPLVHVFTSITYMYNHI